MQLRRAVLLLGIAMTLQIPTWVWAQPPAPADAITANPVLQGEIARAASASSEAQLQASVDKLRELGGAEFVELIPQLVVYLMNAKDVREAMTVGVIIERLHITPAQLATALAPYRASSDPRLRQQIDNLMAGSAEGLTGTVP